MSEPTNVSSTNSSVTPVEAPRDDGSAPTPTPAHQPSFSEIAKRLGPAGPLALLAAFGPLIGTIVLFSTAGLTVPWLREQGVAGVWIYAAGFALCSGLALLPTYAQSGLAGYTFGLVNGATASIGGFIGGGLIGYLLARRVSGERVIAMASENPKYDAIRRALVGEPVDGVPSSAAASGGAGTASPAPMSRLRGFFRTLGLVILLRVPPNSPFAFMNLAMAAVRVPLAPFLIGTAIGMAPRTILAAALGSWVAGRRDGAAPTPTEGVDPDKVGHITREMASVAPAWVLPVGIGVTLVVLLVLGMLAKRVMNRYTTPVAARPAK